MQVNYKLKKYIQCSRQYQSRIIWPLKIIEEAAFSPGSINLSPLIKVTTSIYKQRALGK
jgi:hypothetical protein